MTELELQELFGIFNREEFRESFLLSKREP